MWPHGLTRETEEEMKQETITRWVSRDDTDHIFRTVQIWKIKPRRLNKARLFVSDDGASLYQTLTPGEYISFYGRKTLPRRGQRFEVDFT